MVKKSKGSRSRTRSLLRKSKKEKKTLTKYLQEFNIGSRVVIKPEPASHKGLPYKRFIGKSGLVTNKKGNSYIIKIKDGNKEKEVITRPEHLKAV